MYVCVYFRVRVRPVRIKIIIIFEQKRSFAVAVTRPTTACCCPINKTIYNRTRLAAEHAAVVDYFFFPDFRNANVFNVCLGGGS